MGKKHHVEMYVTWREDSATAEVYVVRDGDLSTYVVTNVVPSDLSSDTSVGALLFSTLLMTEAPEASS